MIYEYESVINYALNLKLKLLTIIIILLINNVLDIIIIINI